MKKYILHSIGALLLSLSLSAGNKCYAQMNAVPDDVEYQALKALYDSLGGPNWTNKTNWPTPGNWPATATAAQMGTWFGISVLNGDIWKVILSGNNLTGKVPAAIGQISQVSQIQLNGNHLNGSLPSSLGSLSKLVWLRFDTNNLTGTIPESLGNLPLVQHLYLSGNSFSGTIPASLGNLSSVIVLGLNNNQLTGSIPGSLGSLSSVSALYLNNNQLSGAIPPSLGDLPQVKTLNLSNNKLTGNIPPTLGNISTLEALFVGNNLLTGPIPASLGSLSNLVYFHLYNNQLTGSIPSELGSLSKLLQLYLYQNNLSGELPSSLGNLNKLQYLVTYTNQLTGTIPASFSNLTDLVVLDLNNNKLSGTVGEIFTSLTKLSNLNLSGNNFTGAFPTSIGNCMLLTALNGVNSKFTSLPASLLSLPVITYIGFTGNELSSIPDFSMQVNKSHLNLYLQNNRLDFSQLEPLVNGGIMVLSPLAQKNINDITATSVNVGGIFMLTARPTGQFSTVVWEKQSASGSWSVVTNDQDSDPRTYTRTTVEVTDGGVYRWRMTNTKVTGVYVQSDPIIARTGTIANAGSNVTNKAFTASWENISSAVGYQLDVAENSTFSNFLPGYNNLSVSGTSKLVAGLSTGKNYYYRVRVVTNSGVSDYSETVAVRTNEVIRLYNGMISSVRWRTDEAHNTGNGDFSGMYLYTYDDRYQISMATWAEVNNNLFTRAGNKYKVLNPEYDPNGNIVKMQRYKEDGLLRNDFSYHYNQRQPAGQSTNQLEEIPGHAVYRYNKIGQLTEEDKATGDDQYMEYDVTGKVRKVYTSKNATTGALEDPKVEFIYDDNGFRLAKKNIDTGKTTWYIRDASGSVMSVYETATGSEDTVQTEIPVYGAGKLGIYYPQQDGSTAYEITDHLGNVRALVRDNITEYTATMEDSGQPVADNPRVKEMQDFVNLFQTEHTDVHMNHTQPEAPVTAPERAAYLFWQSGVNGIEASDKSVGPGIMLEVKAGDKVEAEAWVRYEKKESYSRNIDHLLLSQFLGTSFAGTGGFENYTPSQTASTFQSALTVGNFMSDGDNEERPFAYINYILFNEDMTLADAGWHRIPADAGFTSGQEVLSGMHQRVAFDETVEVEQSGYIYVWVSNESENTRVWFDDLKVTHSENFVTQATDYGVWGDVIREQKMDESTYRSGYQGQFAEKDKETGWNHFDLREYDPIIGRWLAIDPLGVGWSPYLAMNNNGVNIIDPTGGCPEGDCPEDAIDGGDLPEIEITADRIVADPGEIRMNYALNYYSMAQFKYGQIRAGNERVGWALDYTDGYADCAEGILMVLKNTDPNLYQTFTEKSNSKGDRNGNVWTIIAGYEKLGLKPRLTNPKVGDVAVWRPGKDYSGHVMLVHAIGKVGGKDAFSLWGASFSKGTPWVWGLDKEGKPTITVNNPNLSKVPGDGKKWAYGSGTFVGFITP